MGDNVSRPSLALYLLEHLCLPVLLLLFLWYWGLNSGLTLWATPPPLFCEGFFWDRVLWTICLELASNYNPPDLCLLSSWDYRREPPSTWPASASCLASGMICSAMGGETQARQIKAEATQYSALRINSSLLFPSQIKSSVVVQCDSPEVW
jgi:hypothetical protein